MSGASELSLTYQGKSGSKDHKVATIGKDVNSENSLCVTVSMDTEDACVDDYNVDDGNTKEFMNQHMIEHGTSKRQSPQRVVRFDFRQDSIVFCLANDEAGPGWRNEFSSQLWYTRSEFLEIGHRELEWCRRIKAREESNTSKQGLPLVAISKRSMQSPEIIDLSNIDDEQADFVADEEYREGGFSVALASFLESGLLFGARSKRPNSPELVLAFPLATRVQARRQAYVQTILREQTFQKDEQHHRKQDKSEQGSNGKNADTIQGRRFSFEQERFRQAVKHLSAWSHKRARIQGLKDARAVIGHVSFEMQVNDLERAKRHHRRRLRHMRHDHHRNHARLEALQRQQVWPRRLRQLQLQARCCRLASLHHLNTLLLQTAMKQATDQNTNGLSVKQKAPTKVKSSCKNQPTKSLKIPEVAQTEQSRECHHSSTPTAAASTGHNAKSNQSSICVSSDSECARANAGVSSFLRNSLDPTNQQLPFVRGFGYRRPGQSLQYQSRRADRTQEDRLRRSCWDIESPLKRSAVHYPLHNHQPSAQGEGGLPLLSAATAVVAQQHLSNLPDNVRRSIDGGFPLSGSVGHHRYPIIMAVPGATHSFLNAAPPNVSASFHSITVMSPGVAWLETPNVCPFMCGTTQMVLANTEPQTAVLFPPPTAMVPEIQARGSANRP